MSVPAYRLRNPDDEPLDTSLPTLPTVPEADDLKLPIGTARPAVSSPAPTGRGDELAIMPNEQGLATLKQARSLIQAAESSKDDIPTFKKVAAIFADVAAGINGKQPYAVAGIRQQQIDARKAAVEQERLGLERGRFALEVTKEQRAVLKDQLEQEGKLIDETGKLAAQLDVLPAENRLAALNALEARARQIGGAATATIVRNILASPETGKLLAPLARYLPEGQELSARQATAVLMRAGKMDEALERAQRVTFGPVMTSLFQRIDSLGASLKDQYGGKPIPKNVLESAIAASNPNDPAGTNPELQMLNGAGKVYGDGKITEAVNARLAARGFEVPEITAKAVEAKATTEAQKLGELTPEVIGASVAKQITEITAKVPAEIARIKALAPAQAAAAGQVTAAQEKEKNAARAAEPPTPQVIAELRKEFANAPTTKSFIEVRDAFARIETTAKNRSAAGDLALIFGFMKMLDPGSVVREGEFATAQNAAGVPEQIMNLYNRVRTGERLSAAQRTDFVAQSKNLFRAQLDNYVATEEEFKRVAKSQNMKPDDVIIDHARAYRNLAGRAATRAEVEAAQKDAGGDAAKAIEILRKQGINPALTVK